MRNAVRAVAACSVLFACFLFGYVPVVNCQESLSGFWKASTPDPGCDGTYRETFFEIKQDGETVTGSLVHVPTASNYRHIQNGALHATVW